MKANELLRTLVLATVLLIPFAASAQNYFSDSSEDGTFYVLKFKRGLIYISEGDYLGDLLVTTDTLKTMWALIGNSESFKLRSNSGHYIGVKDTLDNDFCCTVTSDSEATEFSLLTNEDGSFGIARKGQTGSSFNPWGALSVGRNIGFWYADDINNKLSFLNEAELPNDSTIYAINETNFPDEIFRNWLMEQEYGSDCILTAEEIAAVKTISVYNLGIQSLNGIEYFTALERLYCGRNQLTELNLSNNTELWDVSCSYNKLITIDVSKNTALGGLFCDNNKLTTLDVSKNSNLTGLSCDSNQLTTLDVSKNTALTDLGCANNLLTDLDVSNNTNLTNLGCAINQLTVLDVSMNVALTELNCGINQLTNLNVSNNTNLKILSCGHNPLTTLDVSQNTALTSLVCEYNQLTELDVSQNTALTSLNCTDNQLTTLNVSQNTLLERLSCYRNQLTTLNVSKNSSLTVLTCYKNQLTTLDVSACTLLTDLDCYNNQIQDEAMNALVESLPSISGEEKGLFYVISPNENEQNEITTLQVVAAKAKGWTVLYYDTDSDEWREYAGSESGGEVTINEENFPDEKFRNWLLQQEYGSDGELTAEEIAAVTEIDVSEKEIQSLKGIEHFTALTKLVCSYNQLTDLDVSKNTALKWLQFDRNQLTTLDVSKNTALTWLDCLENKMTALDVSQNTALDHLICCANQLTTLDVSKNTALTYMRCMANKLTALDVSHNTSLNWLDCDYNQLTTLDISQNTALSWLNCRGNKLTTLDVSQNASLTDLLCAAQESEQNRLLYVADKAYGYFDVDGWNIIRGGQAEEVVLVDNEPLYIPEPFTAQHISYTHNFSKETQRGVASGWESLVLPFDVQSISCDSVEIVPFRANAVGYSKFWLAEVNPETGFTAATSIEANKPYILAMPNSTEYGSGNITGSVTFSATNVTVQPTSNEKTECAAFALTPCWSHINDTDSTYNEIYVLNDSAYTAPNQTVYPAGSVFVRSLRPVRPFEAYYTPANGAGVKEFFPISEMANGIRPTPNPSREGRGEASAVYDLSGRRRSLSPSPSPVREGRAGVYIKDGRKIMVK